MDSTSRRIFGHGFALMALAALCWAGASTAWAQGSRSPGKGDTPPKWYGCIGAAGAIFQVQGNKARCLYPGKQHHKPIIACVAGQTFRQDYQGNADYCVIRVGNIVKKFAPACPGRSWKLLRRPGRDICASKLPDKSWPVMF